MCYMKSMGLCLNIVEKSLECQLNFRPAECQFDNVKVHPFRNIWNGRNVKPLVRLIVVRRLSVDKGQELRSGMLDTSC